MTLQCCVRLRFSRNLRIALPNISGAQECMSFVQGYLAPRILHQFSFLITKVENTHTPPMHEVSDFFC